MINSLVNSVRLMGNVGNNPEVRTFENGNKVAHVSLATNEGYVDKKGEKVDVTEWHRLTFWGKSAEIIENYLYKGSLIMVEGRLKYSSYTDKEGVLRYITEIEVNHFQFLGSPKKDETPALEPTKTGKKQKVGEDNLPF